MTWRFHFCNYQKLIISFLSVLFISILSVAQNPIVTENALAGSPFSVWGVTDFRDNRIAGFSTKMSLNRGETVRFKINVQGAATYTLKIYRIGYYGGNGARLKQDLGTLTGTIQPTGISDPVTGILDCSNWSESASWNIPSNAVSGMYVAKMVRTGGGSNHIVFIVRNDASTSDLYLQMPDATWQAYNGYGGNSLYDGTTGFPGGHAVKVSYNRPIFPYNSAFNTDGRGADWYMNAEYPMIRWLERNGYDVTYTSSNDVDNNGARLLNHNVFISMAHDEYWSKEQRNNVEAARNAGVHLAFFAGNEVYWKTRWEAFDGTENRTLVCYKEGLLGDGTQGERTCGGKCDGSSSEWTGLWRTGGNYDAGKPENGLGGQISWTEFPTEIGVPAYYKKLRFWRNTSIPNLSSGQTAFLGSQTLGYEWDYEQSQYASSYPSGRFTMSSRTINSLTHKLSLYRHSSGALVFGAGTVQWSWGLDGSHWGGTTTISPEMQQATVNLFADMGVQPGSLQPGLTATSQSADFTLPTSTITSPVNNATFSSGAVITIAGTASDAGGGVVAGVEVSVDGGATWRVATLSDPDVNVTWTYSWTTTSNGTFNIRSRGIDDSGNKGNSGTGINVTVGAGDNTPPQVISVLPANGATGVSTTGTIVTANFNETISTATVTTSTFQLRNPGNSLVTATVNTSGNQITLTPSAALSAGTNYTATITGGASGVKDPAGNALASNYSWSFVTGGAAGSCPCTVFQSSNVPEIPLGNDGQGITLGMRFRTTQNGFINGIRYYKGTGATGTHIGSLWTNTGTLLAQATFTNETASGWQQVLFSNPVAVTAGVTYVASYFSPSGDYASTVSYFTQAVINGPLRGLADGEDGLNGVYRYSATSLFPNSSFQATNYWVDVVFNTGSGPDITPPTVSTVSPLNGATGISTSTTITANFSEAINASTVSGTTFQLKDAANNTISATLNTSSSQVTLTPVVALANSTTYTVTIVGGASGVKDLAGNALASNYSWSFATVAAGASTVTIFQPTDAPTGGRSNDGQGIALGVKFRSSVAGSVIGVRYFKPVGTTGTHIGQLWTSTGTLLAQATFTNETASGWQQVLFGSPIAITAGVTYIASYHSPSGDFAASINYFTQAVVNGPLRGLANGESGVNGLYRYTSAALIPNNGYQASNYWADVVFNPSSGSDVTPPTVSSVLPLNGSTGVSVNTTVTANFSEAINASTVTGTTFQLRNSGGTLINATLNTSSNQVTLTPTAALAASTTYTVTITGGASGVKDLAGNALASNYSWSFTTGSVDNTPPTVSSVVPLNGATGISLNSTVTANFSEAINPTTVTGTTVQLRNAGGILIAASLNTSSNQVTLTPSAALAASTVYTVTITGGASGVKDLAGNALASNFSWSFTTASVDNTPPTVTAVTPLNGATGVGLSTTVTASFNEAINASTVTGTTFQLRNAGGTLITATLNTSSNLVTLTPSAALAASTTYTVTITGGASGVKDLAGNALASNYSWSFTTSASSTCPCTVFQLTNTPADPLNNDGQGIVLGMRFRSTQNGSITGIRYYKGAGTTGTHIGSLWSNTGTLLAQATFSNETASGWQQVSLSSPVAITAGVTYVVSYFSPSGHYASTVPYFTQAVVNGPLRGLADGEDGPNGLYRYSATSVFPNSSFNSSNYWVDVVFNTAVSGTMPTITTHPATQTVCAGTNVSFTSAASGSPAPTVQWQESTNGTTWSNIGGATSSTYSVSATTGLNNRQYRAVWSNTTGSVNSNSATLTVNAIPVAPSISVTNNCGNSVLTASGFTGSLLWSNGATTSSITVTTAGNYTVTQTVNGCASAPGSGTAAPLNSNVAAPSVSVVNNCGSSQLTASGFTGSLLWSTGATSASITVTTGGVYTVTQTVNGCTSPAGSGTAAPKAIPSAPTLTVDDNCINSILTASNFSGSLLWSNGATIPSITVTTAGTYTVTQTVNGCTSTTGSGSAAPKPVPGTPNVSVTNNCGNSVLTASGFTGSLLWSTGATTASITVTTAGTYSVTQTVNGCTSASGNGTAAPLNSNITPPSVSVVNNCGNSVLTASGFTGSLLWSTGATTASITVNTAGTYTVTQTVNGCTSPAGSGNAAPLNSSVAIPDISVANDCGNSVLTASGFTGSLLWSTGETTTSITVESADTYTVTQTVNGCTSAPGSGTAAPRFMPPAPEVSVTDNCSNSLLTASGFTGQLLWSNGEKTPSITVTTAGTYTVTQKVSGCTSAEGSGIASPQPTLAAPSVTVINNCGSSILTASGYTGSLLWSTGETTPSITVTTAGTYTVTQTISGCTSNPGSGAAAPLTSSVATPEVGVVNNCGNSVLTASGFTGSLLWSTGETTSSITVTTAGIYTVTQTENGCTSNAGSGTASPQTPPSAPLVTVTDDCTSSILTATNFTGSLLWSTGETTPSITVTTGGEYTVTQTVNGCASAAGNGTASPKPIPGVPAVSVTNSCGSSILTASGFTGSLLWSNNATTTSITVTTAGTYTVTQTVNGCTSEPGSGLAEPVSSTVEPPGVDVVNNCGNSVLTASGFTGSLLWSNGATTTSITVSTGGTYTVTQTLNGCTSEPASGIADPQPVAVLSSSLSGSTNTGALFEYTPTSNSEGITFTWSRASVSGISNPAATGSGSISETLTNTTFSPINVTYVYTLTGEECSNTQNVVITVNPGQIVACTFNGSITSSFNSIAIPAGRYIWFNSVLDPGSFAGISGTVIFYIKNSKITFTANNQQYTLTVPDSRIRFDALTQIASTQFVDNIWETVVPRTYSSFVFMTGLSYLVPTNLPGVISNVKWTADIGVNKTGVSIAWKWAAATYTSFADHSGLNIKPIGGLLLNPYPNTDWVGTPENYKQFVVAGAKSTGGTNYTGQYSTTSNLTCTPINTGQRSAVENLIVQESINRRLPEGSAERLKTANLEVQVMPNPTPDAFNLVINGNMKDPVTIRITDVFGRVLEQYEKIPPGKVMRLGERWKGGTYIAEVIQGDQRKVVKIIKAN